MRTPGPLKRSTRSVMPLSFMLTVLSILSVVMPSRGQAQSFSWSFPQNIGSNIPECSSLAITVPASNTAKAFYMIALAVNGTPTTSLVGTSRNSLSWVVNQPAGTSMLLYLLDSNGATGITPPFLYTVISGQSNSCLPAPTTDFTISGNPTVELSTCEPWTITMNGGTSPYNIVLAAPDSDEVTNVTMIPGDNFYSYINRASPDSSLLAAVHDVNGRWANGTPFVKTKGSTSVTCKGLDSISGIVPVGNTTTTTPSSDTSLTATTIISTPTSNPNNTGNTPTSKSNTAIIVGVCIAILFLLLGALLAFWCYRRRKAKARMDLEPRSFKERQEAKLNSSTASITSSETRYMSGHAALTASALPPKSCGYPPTSPLSHEYHASTLYAERSDNTATNSSSFSTLPTRRPRRPSKGTANVPYLPTTQTQFPSLPPLPPMPSSAVRVNVMDSQWPTGEQAPGLTELIFQHSDAGIVRELPPAYGTQLTGAGASTSS
ncbi:hypothetical protein Hypma_010517 [Hypsizygus marmoreus]|uniref:Uncharacterized protein n=1 Tax=Hypsizygus marmoreus TaxID=39966 RepID=A0A369JKM8_HYPMA|nr:hypothetical protein Hypma_010517 [Hypsizygus marmoreus]